MKIKFIFYTLVLVIYSVSILLCETTQIARSQYKYDLAICAIFKNEARYLKEWIEFHKLVGVQHFILYNNASNDNYLEILRPYINSGEVELIDWPSYATHPNPERWDSSWQLPAYQDALKNSKGNIKWLAFLDTDEFLFCVNKNSLVNFLLDYEQFAGVGVNWLMFGTSNVKKIPANKLLIECLTLRAPYNYEENIHIKSIVRPDYVVSMDTPHSAVYISANHICVNANKETFKGPLSPYIALDKIRIHHYWSRDEDFFYNVKLARRGLLGEAREICIKRNENINKVRDISILKFVNLLKTRVFNKL